MSNVQKLVHLAMRRDELDRQAITKELTKVYRRAYESELTIQLGRVGCSGQRGSLTSGPVLSDLKKLAESDSESIINTYNYDVAQKIIDIRVDVPRANRYTYYARLGNWDKERAIQKAQQIGEWTEGQARKRAISDFIENNGLDGEGRVVPEEAAEEICQGWINRGWIPIRELVDNAPPYHLNCPHRVVTRIARVPRSECGELWAGQ